MIGAMDAASEIRIVDDAPALAEAAAREVLAIALAAVADHGRFTVALAGGATPRVTYERLAAPPLRDRMPWRDTLVFFGDERGVPPDHADSNYGMAHRALLSRVPIAGERVFRIPGEGEDPEAVAAQYARTLADVLGVRRGEVPRLDLVLLGLGVDGHTASLFPGSPVLKETFRTVAAVHSTAAIIPQRFTLTYPVLNAAACVIYLVAGAEKAKVVKAALADPTSGLPAAMVRPTQGRLVWIVDRAAASLLPSSPGRTS
jgi:6-phosphogluconolactonase